MHDPIVCSAAPVEHCSYGSVMLTMHMHFTLLPPCCAANLNCIQSSHVLLRRWGDLSDVEKQRTLRDKACYELFLFLKFADRPLFDAAVAPMLHMRVPSEVDVMTMILLEDSESLERAFGDMHVVSQASAIEHLLAAAVMRRKDMLKRIVLECSGSPSDRQLEQWYVLCYLLRVNGSCCCHVLWRAQSVPYACCCTAVVMHVDATSVIMHAFCATCMLLHCSEYNVLRFVSACGYKGAVRCRVQQRMKVALQHGRLSPDAAPDGPDPVPATAASLIVTGLPPPGARPALALTASRGRGGMEGSGAPADSLSMWAAETSGSPKPDVHLYGAPHASVLLCSACLCLLLLNLEP
jgi:hypothetical protein